MPPGGFPMPAPAPAPAFGVTPPAATAATAVPATPDPSAPLATALAATAAGTPAAATPATDPDPTPTPTGWRAVWVSFKKGVKDAFTTHRVTTTPPAAGGTAPAIPRPGRRWWRTVPGRVAIGLCAILTIWVLWSPIKYAVSAPFRGIAALVSNDDKPATKAADVDKVASVATPAAPAINPDAIAKAINASSNSAATASALDRESRVALQAQDIIARATLQALPSHAYVTNTLIFDDPLTVKLEGNVGIYGTVGFSSPLEIDVINLGPEICEQCRNTNPGNGGTNGGGNPAPVQLQPVVIREREIVRETGSSGSNENTFTPTFSPSFAPVFSPSFSPVINPPSGGGGAAGGGNGSGGGGVTVYIFNMVIGGCTVTVTRQGNGFETKQPDTMGTCSGDPPTAREICLECRRQGNCPWWLNQICDGILATPTTGPGSSTATATRPPVDPTPTSVPTVGPPPPCTGVLDTDTLRNMMRARAPGGFTLTEVGEIISWANVQWGIADANHCPLGEGDEISGWQITEWGPSNMVAVWADFVHTANKAGFTRSPAQSGDWGFWFSKKPTSGVRTSPEPGRSGKLSRPWTDADTAYVYELAPRCADWASIASAKSVADATTLRATVVAAINVANTMVPHYGGWGGGSLTGPAIWYGNAPTELSGWHGITNFYEAGNAGQSKTSGWGFFGIPAGQTVDIPEDWGGGWFVLCGEPPSFLNALQASASAPTSLDIAPGNPPGFTVSSFDTGQPGTTSSSSQQIVQAAPPSARSQAPAQRPRPQMREPVKGSSSSASSGSATP